MEKSELSFMPEWLKVNGSGSVGGGLPQRTAYSSFNSDDHSRSRYKSSGSKRGHQSGHSNLPDRNNSLYSRRSSGSNGSAVSRSASGFGRNNQRRDWEKGFRNSYGTEKSSAEKSSWVRHGRREISNPSEINLPSRSDKDMRRSQSMVTEKRGETLPSSKSSSESSNASKGTTNDSNGRVASLDDLPGAKTTVFERDFPYLGNDEKQVAYDMARASSPGSSTSIKSLVVDTSAVHGADGWASALTKVPALVRSNGASGSTQQAIPPHSVSSNTVGRNIAESLTPAPYRAPSTTQMAVDASRLEELAIKKCRQLIPVTPSMPKALVPNHSEKPKLRHGQQDQITKLHLANQPSRGAPVTSDELKGSTVAKFHVLKPDRERNGAGKEILSPTSISGDATSSVPVALSVGGSAPLRSASNNPNPANAFRRTGLVTLEKRPNPQTKSRNDFFNLVRKKSSTIPSSTDLDPKPAYSPTVLVESGGKTCNDSGMPQNGDSCSSDNSFEVHSTEGMNDPRDNGNAFDKPQEFYNEKNQGPVDNGKDRVPSNAIFYSEEEETALLRLLGWEENAEDDGGLTEEEISSFYKELDEYLKLRPQPKFMVPLNLRSGGVGIKAASGSS